MGGESAEVALRHQHRGRRILLAEDNSLNAEVIAELAKDVGLAVDIAADGIDAVALAKQTRYDLVLMDLQMPRMDGLAAARELRELASYAHVPIIALTANVFADDRARAYAAGMNDFVTKPVDPEPFYEALLRWLR